MPWWFVLLLILCAIASIATLVVTARDGYGQRPSREHDDDGAGVP